VATLTPARSTATSSGLLTPGSFRNHLESPEAVALRARLRDHLAGSPKRGWPGQNHLTEEKEPNMNMHLRAPCLLAAVLAVSVLAACGTTPSTPVTSPTTFGPATLATAAPASASAPALPVAGQGQTVTFSWPGSGSGGASTAWKMTLLGVRALTSGPLSGQPAGYKDFCVELKLALTGTQAYTLFNGQLDPQWTWKGTDGQVIGGSDTGAPMFDSATCQTLFPASEDIASAVSAPAPGQYVTGSAGFYVPAPAGVLYLDNGDGPALLAGIRY
jgi:hypothetical protein